MEVSASVRGECGYCGERVEEEKERWLPLECCTCHQLFHLRCFKVSSRTYFRELSPTGLDDCGAGPPAAGAPRGPAVAVHVRSLPPSPQGDLHQTLFAVVGVARLRGVWFDDEGISPLKGSRDPPCALSLDGDPGRQGWLL